MNVADLITILREDYLDDEASGYLWSDAFLLRALAEAEKQACNRCDMLYDDSSTEVQINLKHNVASYTLSPKITAIERVEFNSREVIGKSKQELDRSNPSWRSLTGIVGVDVNYVINGRNIRFTPVPHGSKDAIFVQADTPTANVDTGDTWWDTDSATLYRYNGTGWVVSPNATLRTVYMECYRLPYETQIDEDYEFEIPEEYHHDLIYWALHEAYKKQDADTFDQEKADYYLARFDQTFGKPVSAGVRMHSLQGNKVLTARPHAYVRPVTSADSDDDEWFD